MGQRMAWFGLLIAGVAVQLALGRQDAPATAPAAAPAPAPLAVARPNLVLITMDTTRADHLGCYGYPRPTTPQIDAFAAESVVFDHCYSALTHTTPSHTSIFTGVYPFEHGVLSCSFRADEKVQQQRAFVPVAGLRSYTEILAEQGWQAGGFVTAATTKKITGLGVGFAAWGEPTKEVRPGAEALAEALAWLDTVPEPFFLWAHFFDAHVPPREQYEEVHPELAPDAALREVMAKRRMGPPRRGNGSAAARVMREREEDIARYDTGLRLIDDHFAALRAKLEARGAWPHTTVVITGDHGEGLGQHNFVQHGPVWAEGVHVPFLLRVPGRAPERIETLCSTIDVLPTAIAATTGLPAEEFLAQARGRDVLAAEFEERPVYSMSPPTRGEFSLTTRRWRWIHRESGKHALFDRSKDPFELKDVAADHPEVAAGLDRQLLELIREQRARHLELYDGKQHGTRLSAEAEARLRAELAELGYTEEGDEAPLPGKKRPAEEDGDADDGDDDGAGEGESDGEEDGGD